MSNMIFMSMLSGVCWESVVQMLDLHERTIGVGDGSIEGFRYIIIQRGDEVLLVLPDYQPREKCFEAAKKIFSKLAPESAIQIVRIGRASSHCNFCLMQTPLPYRCHRCYGWFCESHRLPEKHNCPGEKGKVLERIRFKIKKEKKKGKKEIVVVEAPCG